MAWDIVSMDDNEPLPAVDIRQLQLNFKAMADQDSGSPVITFPNSALNVDAGFVTGGTGTHKPMGVISINATQVSRSTTGVLMTFTLPANTLDANGKAIRIQYFLTKTGTNGPTTVQFRFGDTPTSVFTVMNTSTAGNISGFITIVRVSATAVDIFHTGSNTSGGNNETFNAITSGITLGSDQTIDFNVSVINASDVSDQELMLIELLN